MKRIRASVIFTLLCSLVGCGDQSAAGSFGSRPNQSPEAGEVVVVIMAGWLQVYGTMEPIERAVRRELSRRLPQHRISIKRKLAGLLPEGDSDLFLVLEYAAWKQRKDTPAGRYSEFVAIGHSSGATAIYNGLRGGAFQNGRYLPAFLGMVDMILPIGPHDLTGKIPQNGGRRTSVAHYYIPTTARISGIRNIMVPGANHFSIVSSGRVMRGLSTEAATACLQGPRRPAAGQDRMGPGATAPRASQGQRSELSARQAAHRGGRYER